MAAVAVSAARHAREETEREQRKKEDEHSERMRRIAHEADGSSGDDSDAESESDLARRQAPQLSARSAAASNASAPSPSRKPLEAPSPPKQAARVVGFDTITDVDAGEDDDEEDSPVPSPTHARVEQTPAPAPTPPMRKPARGITFGTLVGTAQEVHSLEQKTSVRSMLRLVSTAVVPQPTDPLARGTSLYFTKTTRRARELPEQRRVHKVVTSTPVQIIVAILILANFIVSAAEAQLLPPAGSEAQDVFFGFEVVFNACFTVELIANLYGSWFRPFWRSPWNVFDFFIVSVSWLSMYAEQLPGIGVLRLFRAFRVFRLFRRIRSLRLIIEGVLASMPGVSNAFVVLILLMGIWSIIGVEFFGAFAPQEFGNFSKAMFSMWQAMTGDEWSGMARPLIYEAGNVLAAPFFISYVLVASIVMANVVIAILLDRYLNTTARLDAQLRSTATRHHRRRARKQLWLVLKVLREGRLAVANQIRATRKVERAAKRWLDRLEKKRDRPHWSAHKALASVLGDTLKDVFSERAVYAHSSRQRLGLVAALWNSRVTRQALQANQWRCTEDDTFLFAKTSEITALAHHILGFLRDVEEREQRGGSSFGGGRSAS